MESVVTTSTGVFVFACGSPAGPAIGALNPLAAGVALKLDSSKTADTDSRVIEKAIWSVQPWIELFCCFFIGLFDVNHFSRFTEGGEVIAANDPC